LTKIDDKASIKVSLDDSKRSQLRAAIRDKRRNLSPAQQERAALNLFEHIQALPEFQNAQTMAFYIPIDGEISPLLIIQHAQTLGKQCYLPVLRTDGQKTLLFAEYTPDTHLQKGQLSLSEPLIKDDNTILAKELDTVFMPLVGFDAQGARLGMGGGYYDRSFAFLKATEVNKPTLVGIAHECQRVEKLEVASWDVPLEKIVTDLKVYKAK
jgi:5-formyltetrahydrofolate cyclo-ligase